MLDIAMKLDCVSKFYKLYNRPVDRLKESLNVFRKQYHKEYYALNDINFEIQKGESVGIIGANGAGKSTLLKIITGVLSPSSGSCIVNGKIAALLELGTGFNPEYSGMENIFLNGTMMGFTEDEIKAKVEAITDFADIGEFIHQPVKTYSSGMFARLAFSVAINVEPEILIVDEALSVGDVFFQLKCYKKFQELQGKGITILLVTHDLSSVIKYCSRAILLNQGNLLLDSTPKDAVDTFKRLSTNNLSQENAIEQVTIGDQTKSEVLWSSHYTVNSKMLQYGNHDADIIDFGIFDDKGKIVNTFEKGESYVIKMKVEFHTTLVNPIFAVMFKDMNGLELCGTNTRLEGVDTGTYHAGEQAIAAFTAPLLLQNQVFFLSFGCTDYNEDGSLQIYHRLYDIICIQPISDKFTCGLFDMNTKISVKKLKG